METRQFANGTSLINSQPWGMYHGGRAMCSDGKVRAIKRIAPTPDTFFSIPASVTVKGKTVAGYVTTDTVGDDEISTVKFIAYTYRKNGNLI